MSDNILKVEQAKNIIKNGVCNNCGHADLQMVFNPHLPDAPAETWVHYICPNCSKKAQVIAPVSASTKIVPSVGKQIYRKSN